MFIKELTKDNAYIIEFDTRCFFNDSGTGEKYIYYRIGDISKTFPDQTKKYSIVVRSAEDLTTEELMVVLSSFVEENKHKERIIQNINNLLK